MNYKEEAIIKILGKTQIKIPNINQLELRDVLDEVLDEYEVLTAERALVSSDIEEKLEMFIGVKRLEGLSKLTLKNYYKEILKFGDIFNKPVNSITTSDLRRYFAVISQNVKQTTLATKISILKTFFGWLVQEEYIAKDPTKKIKTPKIGKRLRNSLTVEELEILRNNCETLREKALLEFLFATGCRLSEIHKINLQDINWQELSLQVIGKGDKQRKVYFTIKSKIHLKEYLDNRKDNCPALFVTCRRPIRRLGKRSIEKEIGGIAKRAKFDKAVFPHLLRHTFATIALNNKMPITVIQQLMGHKSCDTTMVYAELDESTLKQEYKKL